MVRMDFRVSRGPRLALTLAPPKRRGDGGGARPGWLDLVEEAEARRVAQAASGIASRRRSTGAAGA